MRSEIIKNNLVLAVPAVLAFIMALIPTLTNPWPLSWDIFYHLHLAQVYTSQGLVFINPLINPLMDNVINYPPLFHLLLSGGGILFNLNYFQVARAFQPLLAGFIILSTSITAFKFYGKFSGVLAGIIIFSSALISRVVLPIPENLALIFLPLSIYFYYHSFQHRNYKFAILAGLIMGLMALIHQAATFCLVVAVSSITLILLIKNSFKPARFINLKRCLLNYLFYIISGVILAAWWWIPAIYFTLNSAQGGGVSTALSSAVPMNIVNYPGAFGYLLLFLSLIGGYRALIKYRLKDIFIITWIISMLLLSQSYLVGVNVISYRVLVYILIPISIIAAYGLKNIIFWFKSQDSLYSKIAYLILGLIVIFSMFQGYSTFSSPKITEFGAETPIETVAIAPPSRGEIELGNWMQQNVNQTQVATFSNYYTSIFILSYTHTPVSNLLHRQDSGILNESDLITNQIDIVVYDKKLNFTGSPDSFWNVNNQFLFYNSKKINIANLDFTYWEKVYENQEFVVYQVLV